MSRVCRIQQVCSIFLLATLLSASGVAADDATEARSILDVSGFHGGLIVQVDPQSADVAVELGRQRATQVHALVTDSERLDSCRSTVMSAGLYGTVTVDRLTGKTLPYVDNLVNLLIVEQAGSVSQQEMMRVLVPEGSALVRNEDGQWNRIVKPRPDNIDEWTHYLHDPSGNAVAHDEVVAPPRHLQWVGSPRWSRHHDRMASMSALVSSGGRIFYIMDEGSRISIQLPPSWKLIARDAFNGSVLWKKDIPDWQNHLWPLKSGPTQLSRRLVATGNTVFTTLGYNAPLTAIDAVTGETLRSYKDSESTEEVISVGRLLFVVARKGTAALDAYVPLNGRVGDQARARDFFWNEEPRVLMAFEAETGRRLWARKTRISPLTLGAGGSKIFFHDGEKVVSVDQQTGETAWESEVVSRRKSFTFNFGPRLVIHEDVVLFAGGDGRMFSLGEADGKQLWTAEHPNSGYQSPQDLMVVDGLVWCAPTTSGRDTGVFTGRDPRTGEVQKQFAPDVDTYWFHHRCYIAKATDNFLMPSRTGIEFVDPDQEHWDIHHWVRGGCLYGVMPCNGLTYAPPHNCACYPEAKLFGFNALAPTAPTRPVPAEVPEQGRLEPGPAWGEPIAAEPSIGPGDWPTYRHDNSRSGTSGMEIPHEIGKQWVLDLGGRLTSPVIAAGRVFVAQIDRHTLHAINEKSGQSEWQYTIGSRIDSPPTVADGRIVFGGADGWVYCLRLVDGELIWRYRAAPIDRRTMAYEQLESLWPVHGSVLVREGLVYCVAGRSNFLDGGLRLLRLRLDTGEKLTETIMDETNPETGNNLQEKLQILQMPVGLPDILSADEDFLYMKSQKFDFEGKRLQIGPNSGEFAAQASVQRGRGAHIFAPMGFLDETWFHRSYWVLGQSFAGGHGGYFQAGRFAPSGRILVNGNGYVFGYGRKPEYLRWTTTLEHQLFAAEPNPPEIPEGFGKKNTGTADGPMAMFGKPASLNPAGKPLTIEAWMTATAPQGVIAARGGPAQGFALVLKNGKPEFLIRADSKLTTISGPKRIIGGWHHIAGVLTRDRTMQLFVDGKLVGEGTSPSLLTSDPAQGFEVGGDAGGGVGDYQSPHTLTGIVDEVRLYLESFDEKAIHERFSKGSELSNDPVLVVSFDDGSASDLSVHRNNGNLRGGKIVEGYSGKGVQFSRRTTKKRNNANTQNGNSLVRPVWKQDIPIYVRGMVLAGDQLFIVGPPDIIDEEQTFQQLTEQDEEVQQLLSRQDEVLRGDDGARLLSVDSFTGEVRHEVKIDSLPTWDGLAGANGRLYLTTLDGRVMSFGK